MSVQNFNHNSAYGFNNPLQPVINPPVIADRAPTTADIAEIGTSWIDQSNGDIYFLTKITGAAAEWQVAAGATTVLSDLTVTPGPTVIDGDFTVNGTNVNLSSTADMNLTTSGAGIDINLATLDGSITVQASEDVTNAVYLQADGGVNATILIENTLGTGLDAIQIAAPAGTLDIDVASIDIASTSSFDITATGDITLQAGSDLFLIGDDTVQITGSGAFANAILLNATDAASGIDVNAGSAGITVDTTGAISLDSGAASNFTVAGAFDLTLRSTAGSIVITGDQAAADAVQINATSGGGVDINAGILGATIDSAAGISIDSVAASNITVTGAFDLDIESTLGAVNISSGQIAADAIVIDASGGGVDISAVDDIDVTTSTGDINLDSTLGAIQLTADTDIRLDPNATLTMAPAATVTTIDLGNITTTVGRTTTVNGGAVISAVTDNVSIAGGGVNTNAAAEKVVDIAVGDTLLGLTEVNIASGDALSGTHSVNISTGLGGGTKRVDIGDVDALTAITAYGTIALNTSTSTGTTAIGNMLAGAITVDSSAGISLDAAAASNFSVSGAGIDLTLASSGGRVIVSGSEAAADAVEIAAPAGAVQISGGAAATLGNVRLVNQQVATAAPGPAATAAATCEARIGSVTFTGYTQAAAATLILTLTNAFILPTTPVIMTVSNNGANAAFMQITRIDQTASGTAVVTMTNNGAAALNGDMVLSFIVLA